METEAATAEPVTAGVLVADLKAVVRDAEALLRATEGQAGERIAEVRAKVKESLHQAKTRIDEVGVDVGARAREAGRSTNAYVHENPWPAIGVAALVGFLLGNLGHRR